MHMRLLTIRCFPMCLAWRVQAKTGTTIASLNLASRTEFRQRLQRLLLGCGRNCGRTGAESKISAQHAEMLPAA